MNVCMCGVQDGYPHERNCPFPYYGGEDKMMARWELAQIALEAQLETLDNMPSPKWPEEDGKPIAGGAYGHGVNE